MKLRQVYANNSAFDSTVNIIDESGKVYASDIPSADAHYYIHYLTFRSDITDNYETENTGNT